MRISELARRAGVAPSAVRWYEQMGVLPGPERGPNGARDHAEGDLARLRLVVSRLRPFIEIARRSAGIGTGGTGGTGTRAATAP